MRLVSLSPAAAAIIGASLCATPIMGAEPSYAGKQVKLHVGSSPGGGYDVLARAVAAHMGRHLPGKPNIIVQNAPGAASRKVANWIYNAAPRDGTVFASVFSAIPTEQLFNPTLVQFDARKFTWLGSASRDTAVGVVWHAAAAQSLVDVKGKQMIVGSSGGITYDFPTVVREILGLNFKVITGYKGTKEIGLAMERGELDGNAGLIWASVKTQNSQELKDGKLKVFVQYGRTPDPELKGVPMLLDLVKNSADRQALNLVFARQDFSRPYIAPPGLAPEVAATLRRAFEATMKDEAFIVDAKKRKFDITLVSADEMEKLMAELYATPKPVIARVRSILSVEGAKKKK